MFSAILRKTYSSFPPKSLERFAVKCFSGVWSSAATLCVEIKQCFDFFKYIFCLFICLCKLLRNISWRSKLAAIAMLLLEGLWIICQNKLFFIFFCGSNPSASDCWGKLNQSQEMPCITSFKVDFTACLKFFRGSWSSRRKAEGGGKSFHSVTAWKSYQNTHLFSHSLCLVLSSRITLFTTRLCFISSEPKLITQNFHYCKFSSDFTSRMAFVLFSSPFFDVTRGTKPDPSISVTWSQRNFQFFRLNSKNSFAFHSIFVFLYFSFLLIFIR